MRNSWDTTKADMTTPRNVCHAVVLAGELHVIGGKTSPLLGGTFAVTAEKYDALSDSWSDVPGMAAELGGFGCFAAACE